MGCESKDYEFKIVDYVLDNVHGYIGLTQVEKEIEELPVFQRLRRIKQLGLADIIFPGAEHTRYIHSLGVMHIIDQMSLKLGFNDEDRQKARLAGMLHDIGHYPLSHLGEAVYKSLPIKQNIIVENNSENIESKDIIQLSNEKVRKSIEEMDDDQTDILNSVLMSASGNCFHHENITSEVIKNSKRIREIIDKNCSFIKIEDICEIITGDIVNDKNIVMVQLLHSELDADRLDYLLRDAAYSGAGYGKIELGSILKNISVKKHSKYNVDIVGVTPKGIAIADQFLVNRFFAYSQVIFHKYVAVLGRMSRDIMKFFIDYKLFPDGEKLKQYIIDPDSDDYIKFNDDYFFNILNTCKKNEDIDIPENIEKIIDKLIDFRALNLNEKPQIYSNKITKEIQYFIKETNIYGELLKDKGENIYVLDSVTVTKHVPKEDFCEAFSKCSGSNPQDGVKMVGTDLDIDDFLKNRLINGIAVIELDSCKDPELLIDSKMSLIKELSRYQEVFFSQYTYD